MVLFVSPVELVAAMQESHIHCRLTLLSNTVLAVRLTGFLVCCDGTRLAG